MNEPLTLEQRNFARHQMARWLEIKERYEPLNWSGEGRNERRWEDGEFTQLRMDILHSSLLMRLLSGKEPLPEPPPLKNAYPDYRAVEEEEEGG